MEGGVGAGLGAGEETDLGDAEEAGVEGRVEEQVGACLEGRAGTGVEEGMEARLGESLGTGPNPPRRASRLQVTYPPTPPPLPLSLSPTPSFQYLSLRHHEIRSNSLV